MMPARVLPPPPMSLAKANNTLIISYEKPAAFLVFEKVLKAERDKMKAADDGDVDCTTQ